MKRGARSLLVLSSLFVGVLLTLYGPRRRPELWQTADQSGDRLLQSQRYAEAAKTYVDPLRRGVALYRAGDFKAAASSFSQLATPAAVFNRANCLVMLGKYDDALKGYDRALTLRPGWAEATENRAIAAIRRDRVKQEGGDESGGQIDPDEVVFGKGKNPSGEQAQVDAGSPLSDEQLRTVWLRRVQTKPADFLRSKFAFQIEEQKGRAP